MNKRKNTVGNVTFYTAETQNSMFWESFSIKKWEEQTFLLLDKYIKSGTVFIDIGCWEGPFTLYAASLGATVHAIDPDEQAISALKKHIELNPGLMQKIFIHRFALSCEDMPMNLFERGRFGDSASSILKRTRDTGNSTPVTGKNFNTFLTENNISEAGLIKMDIEGGEYSVVPGMLTGLKSLDLPPFLLAVHAVYLKENYMSHNSIQAKISKLNGKLSILLGRLTADKHVKGEIIKLIESLGCYDNVRLLNGNNGIVKELLRDGMVLFC